MCGIVVVAGEGDANLVARMTNALSHRGPDAQRVETFPDLACCLGHARLSILDHQGGSQPMATRDGALCVVFNGEIYNWKELRHELQGRGHSFVSDHSDTEVLLHGYREWGEELPLKLNGMWAFVILDVSRKCLFASRDRFGQKPIYFCVSGQFLAIASELHALLLHPKVPGNLSLLSMQKYFGYGFIPAPMTICESVHKLSAGHNLKYELDGSLRVWRYWDYVIEPFEDVPDHPEHEWGERLQSLLQQAVARHMQADVPVGLFLSGGIDSSTITALAVRQFSADKVKTFSIGFTEKSFDESTFARQVAAAFKVQHHERLFSQDQLRSEAQFVSHRLDEPMGDSSILPASILCREARKNVTVALGGDGGDELFCGYDPFLALKPASWYHRLVPGPIHDAIRWLVGLLPVSSANMSLEFKLKRTLLGLSHSPDLWLPTWMCALEPNEIAELLNYPCEPENVFSEAISLWDEHPNQDIRDKATRFFVRLYLQDGILTKMDRASMMHSLEVRSPFLDTEVADFARRIPARYRLHGNTSKYILKQAMQSVLPAQIINRKKKGFGVPLASWFKDWEFPHPVRCVNSSVVEAAITAHQAGTKNEKLFLWNHVLLQAWLNRNMGSGISWIGMGG